MFIGTRIMRDEGDVSSASLGNFTQPAATPQARPVAAAMPTFKSASDVFDHARDMFKEDDSNFDDDGVEVSDEHNTGEDAVGTSENDQGEQTPQKPAAQFSPYSYKGKVFGEEHAQEFKTQKELDSVISKGLAAQHLYKAHQDIKAKLAELEPDAQWGRDLVSMVKSEPKEFLDLLRDELIPQEVLAEWVHDAYQNFSNLAKMDPETRAKEQRLREYEKMLEERKYLEQENMRLQEQKARAVEEEENRKFQAWHTAETQKWAAKVPVEYRESVNTAMRAVVGQAKAELDAGKKVTLKDLTKNLEGILAPYVHAKSPSQHRREAGAATEQRRQASSTALQGAVNSAQRSTPTQTSNKPTSVEDVFNWASKRVASGQSKLRE